MSNDYWNAYKSWRPGDSSPAYSDLCKNFGHYAADQIQRGMQHAQNDHQRQSQPVNKSNR